MAKPFKQKLLPYRYKQIGFMGVCFTVATFIALLFAGLTNPHAKAIITPVLQLCLILSLLLVIISKEKTEDEFVQQIRIRTLAGAAIAVIVMAIVDIVFWKLIYPQEQGNSLPQAVVSIQIFYIIFFHYNKHYLGEYE